MQGKFRRPSPAMVVALIALVLSLGGTGYAAISITGKNIKRGSITGSNIKNDSLSGKQIKESRLGTVPRSKIADKLSGPAATKVTTRGFFASQEGSKTFGGDETTIGTLSLPAGGYLMFAKLTLSNESGNTSKIFCHLKAGDLFDETIAFLTTGSSFANTESMPLQGVASSGSPFTAVLSCRSEGGGGLSLGKSGLQRALNAKISAVRTDTLDLSSFK